MPDSMESSLGLQAPTDIATLFGTGFDLTKTPPNRKFSVQAVLAAYLAANGGGGGSGARTNHIEGVSILPGAYADNVLYAPQLTNTDIFVGSLVFGQASIIPQAFNFQIYAGAPASGGVLVYDSLAATGTTIQTASAVAGTTLYVPAAIGSNTLYIRVTNGGLSTLTLGLQGVFIEFAGNGVSLPTYVPPAPYLGPLLATVLVGPTRQFTQPLFGLQALADGGTMILDDGHYYFPIGLLNSAQTNITAATATFGGQNYNVFGGTTAHPANRFTGGITIKSASGNPYSCIWDGLGGVANYDTQTGGYRLAFGKGLIYTTVPITVQGISFISAGGADIGQTLSNGSISSSDGAAAVYAENFLSPGTVTVQNCGFDNCENGVFVPDLDVRLTEDTYSQNTGPGLNVSVVLDTCDFGLNAGNGSDGYSHNIYYEGPSLTIQNSNMYSTRVGGGNTIKCRGPLIVVENSYVEAGQGRALDMPEGGSATFTGCTLVSTPLGNQAMMDYNGEYTVRPWRLSSLTSVILTGCTVIGSRNPFSTFWNDTGPASSAPTTTPACQFVFTDTTQFWYNAGNAPGFLPQRVQSTYLTDDSAVTGLFLTPSAGGTSVSGAQVRPGSIAQPGATPTPFTAWNGLVSHTF